MKYLLFITSTFFLHLLHGQSCQVTFNGSACTNNPIQFTGSLTGTTHYYDFNGEGTASGQRVANFTFKTAGNKQITYITTIGSTKCTSTVSLVIKAAPVIKLTLYKPYTQCFENNLYCFKDSSFSPSGAKLKKLILNINDGQLFQYTDPKYAGSICFSFKDERGGDIVIWVELEDENGCVTRDTINPAGHVQPKIGAKFTRVSPKNPSCDSVQVTVTNVSRISVNDVKFYTWYWGDGSTTSGWGPILSKTYKKQGIYDIKFVITANTGCSDSFTFNAAATVFSSKVKIISSADSVCAANPKISFGLLDPPTGMTGFLWNFGDPASGPKNFDNRNIIAEHAYTTLGPVQVKLSVTHPVCGTITVYDTALILGPQSVIEQAGNRIPEFEVFQCNAQKQETVHFKNLSKYYHNDANYLNDDSIQIVNGKWRHVFNSQQVSVKPSGYVEAKNRGLGCAQRLWDFGDIYCPRCTSNSAANENNFSNCRYSKDSLPGHYFSSWEDIFLKQFKFEYFEEGIFDASKRSCGLRKIFPSDTFVVFYDTLLSIPASSADSSLAASVKYQNIVSRNYLGEKWFVGKGSRHINNYVDIKLSAGSNIEIIEKNGSTKNISGPLTYSLVPGEAIASSSASDSVTFLFTEYILRDTMPVNFLRLRANAGFRYTTIAQYVKSYPGIKGKDYVVDYNRFRQMFYAKVPTVFTVKLAHRDTCNKMHCASENTKQISVMQADAGGPGVGLRQESNLCFDGSSPQLNVTFILSDLKPGANFSYMAVNKDTHCSNTFVPFNSFSTGSKPPYGFYVNYNVSGNPGGLFSTQYYPSEVCGKNNCVTVGIIMGNGVSKSGSRPLCADTQYYDKMFCFPEMDTRFVLLNMQKNVYGNYKICKGAVVAAAPNPGNNSDPHDLKYIKWQLKTSNAGRNFSNDWSRYVLEEYHFNEFFKDSGTTKLYNYLVVSRGASNPSAITCSDLDQNNAEVQTQKPDTIITAVISRWDTAVIMDKAWDSVAGGLRKMGFDPFAIDKIALAKMIWNGKGTLGMPATGARGCLDTTGYGTNLKFEWIPDPLFTKILHYRDTSVLPLDSVLVSGKWQHAYSFKPGYNGYHMLSMEEMAASNSCTQYAATPIIVGFAAKLELPDSVVGREQGTSLKALTDFRYFHPDPINFGTWDTYDYWRDPFRQLNTLNMDPNTERFTRWDWNKQDDESTNPITIFGGTPYGATGVGTPWKDLGGGGSAAFYYKNDSGVYIMRVAAGDSSGCMDTISRRIFVTRLDVSFGLAVSVPSCNSIVEFFDSTQLFDPCLWARMGCVGPQGCDFINHWSIDWGDGTSNVYARSGPMDPGLPSALGHKYNANKWFRVAYEVRSAQGAMDSFIRWVYIPGPRPKFAIQGSSGRNPVIYTGDSLTFVNLSDSASASADYTWFFGDGQIFNTSNKLDVTHKYSTPGIYYVFLQEYDSLRLGPIKKFCSALYPDTLIEAPFRVEVLPSLRLKGLKSEQEISIYPNPAGDEAVILGAEVERIRIYSSDGREVFEGKIYNNRVPLSALAPGCYLTKVTDKNGRSYAISIIKE